VPVKLSVVTPFYNTAAYLPECIESVLGQSYGDFEYLLVDNHSTDGSADVAARYAARDRRIRVLRTPEFFPQIPNYNFALANAPADASYVKMVQADDWLYPRCLTEMLELAEANPKVAIVSSYVLRGNAVHGSGLPPTERVMSGRQACRLHLLDGIYMFGSPSALLLRGDVVRARKPFYAVGRYHEDSEAVYEILRDGDFGFVHQVLSFTRTHTESITGGESSFDPHALDRFILVKLYAADCLSPEELAACRADAERRYYGRLAHALLARRGNDYWEFHKKWLATAGETIDRAKIARYLPGAVRDLVAAPRALLSQLRR
jgi:glycosyltransferase involved in cell wall biosynthesis